ncbi:MAG: hypothetical protein H7Y36_12740, partial [Armatimonadetes bacterium]|nr:hypothetical protein [Akkermansiaceae bacterium]
MLKLLFTFALSLQALHSQELIFRQVADTKTDTYVEVMSLFSHPSLGGYHPVRVIIANNQKIPHKVFLNFKDSNGYGDALSTTSSYSFFAAPGKTVTNDILVPLGAQNGVTSYQSL